MLESYDAFVVALAMNEPKPEAETDCGQQASEALKSDYLSGLTICLLSTCVDLSQVSQFPCFTKEIAFLNLFKIIIILKRHDDNESGEENYRIRSSLDGKKEFEFVSFSR